MSSVFELLENGSGSGVHIVVAPEPLGFGLTQNDFDVTSHPTGAVTRGAVPPAPIVPKQDNNPQRIPREEPGLEGRVSGLETRMSVLENDMKSVKTAMQNMVTKDDLKAALQNVVTKDNLTAAVEDGVARALRKSGLS